MGRQLRLMALSKEAGLLSLVPKSSLGRKLALSGAAGTAFAAPEVIGTAKKTYQGFKPKQVV